MKKNIALFAIFLALLGFTYWWQEKGEVVRQEKKRMATQALKELDLPFAELKLSGLELKRNAKGELRVFPGDFPVDTEFFVQFQESLRALVNVDDIEPLKIKDFKREEFFPPSPVSIEFVMANGEKVTYFFGRFFDLSQKFAMERITGGKSELFLARNDYQLEGFFQSEKDFEQQKYSMVIGQLSVTATQMVDKKLSRLFGLTTIKSMEVGPDNSQRPFTVDFEKGITIPAPPRGVKYASFDIQKVTDLINGLSVTEIKSAPEPNSTSKGHIVLWKNDSEALQIVLWKENEGQKNYWIHYPGRDEVLVLDEQTLQPFHLNVQDFWNKQLSPLKAFDQVLPLPFDLNLKGKWSSLRVESGEQNDFIRVVKGDQSLQAKEKHLLSLVAMVIGRDPKIADHLLFKSYKEILSEAIGKKAWFVLKILGSEFTFIKTEAWIYVYDKGKGVTYAFDWKSLSSLWEGWDSVK